MPQINTNILQMGTVFSADLCKICFFSLHPKEIFPIFAPAIPGEIGTARESAFFALFLSSKLGHFTKSRNIIQVSTLP